MKAQKIKKQIPFFRIQKDNLLELYLKEIGKVKRLTQREIKSLMNIIAECNKKLKYYSKKYKIDIDELSFLDNKKVPEKIKEKILLLIHKKERAKESLIKSNLKLVVKIAEKYKAEGLNLLDLISEGNIGLIEGIERYDINRGTKLSTYVSWWIKQKINLAILNQAHTIRLPKYVYKILQRYRQISEKLTSELGYPPTLNQIADKVSLPINKLIEILQYAREPVSLETRVDEQTELKEIIEDRKSLTPFEAVYYISFIENLEQIIKRLKYNEQIVINMRFGLFGTKACTLSEIGRYLGVSTERVRQILKSGLANLKSAILGKEKELF